MSLKDAMNKLGKAVGDLSSLTVESYVGDLMAIVQGSAADGTLLDWQKLVSEAGKTEGKVRLKLASRFNFDGDATLFVAEGEIPQDVRVAHDAAVMAGRQIRKDLLDLAGDTVRKLF
jgi:hypothetical protein